MAERTYDEARRVAAPPLPLPLLLAGAVYVLLLASGAKLLNDPDTYWHLAVGRWIVAHGAVPHSDMFSHTFFGRPWIAEEWLAQVLYAVAYAAGGWAGTVTLACAGIAAAFGLLVRALKERLDNLSVLVLATAALVLVAPHALARPHALGLPVMVAWFAALVRANDRGEPPSLWLLPLMTLWANLHGGFTLGLVLLAPLAVEAAWNAAPAERKAVALRWLRFALLAVMAACVTPYGVGPIMSTVRAFGLGQVLSNIGEWRSQDFSSLGTFESALLLALAFALHSGLRLPVMRIVLLLGVLHLALSHVRAGEALGLLGPMFLAAPLAAQFGAQGSSPQAPRARSAWASGAVLVVLVVATALVVRAQPFAPAAGITPALAAEKVKQIDRSVLNDHDLGGYLVFAGVPTFIDGRTELYGETFYMRYLRAVTLQDLPDFLRLLDEYQIGATLLTPATPAVALLDRLPGWERLYADATAVVHRRREAADLRGSLDARTQR
jgi:hypothetical protein